MLGLRFCARAFSSCGKRGPLFITVRGPLTVTASLVAENRLQTHRLSNCGSRAQPLCGMWDPPRPGLEPVSPALAGRFSTTAPPGKPSASFLQKAFLCTTAQQVRADLFVPLTRDRRSDKRTKFLEPMTSLNLQLFLLFETLPPPLSL